ncbi:T9SS type A sorting domain-containing protein [Chryseobacterium sp. Leaf394]|uniref:T9SS type A sorting domain-containing protein n=1 Tax=Chryseobacterium sp. Leaf394 TaxID=1736361 RepID=UPI0007004BF5|nr:T9SS type A sorting domain-containing protein [Chryseobacterium sp. Leaf394]KQS91546.1 hypothetical protein ASG21_03485 [Chryseobacterium sp. Leaf394]
MKKFLLSCFLILSMSFSAQITLGGSSTDVGVAPISTYYGYSYVQQIFTKQEINANAAGNITGLKFYLDPNNSISSSSQWVVYLGQTSKTSFTSDSDWIPSTQLVQVFSGTVSNVNGVVNIVFPTPFAYDNISNLVVAAEENSAGYDNNANEEAMFVYAGAQNSSIYYRDDNVDPDPASPPVFGNLVNYKSVTTFEGLVLNPIPACPVVTYPGNNSTFVPLSPVITWNNVVGATGYKVSVGTAPNGTDIANQIPVSTNSFTPASPLSQNTAYYVKVVSVGAAGESSGCTETTFSTVPPAPTNDDCATAITLAVNPDLNCGSVTAGYTLGATDSGLVPDPCYGDPDDDVWFKFIATDVRHRISLSNVMSVGTVDDDYVMFQVFSGSCGTLTDISCVDYLSETITGLTVGDTYWIRVYSYSDAGSRQSFNICVGAYPPPPANDACSGAVTVTSYPFTYNQVDAAGSTNNAGFITVCSPSEMNDGTWFTFTGNGNTYDITVSMPAGSDFDPEIGVYSGSCGSLVCVDTVDDNGSGGAENISVSTTAGETYYVNVGHYSSGSDEDEGPFTIDILNGNLATSEVKSSKNLTKVYPNPFTDVLTISDVKNVKSIMITDMSGKTVRTIQKAESTLYLNDLNAGMYLVILNMNDGSKQTIKAIKR